MRFAALALLMASPVTVSDEDVRPSLELSTLSRVAPSLRAATPAEVADALDGRDEPEARFLRGRALVQAGRGAEALPVLAGLSAALPDIADRVEALSAAAAESAGRTADAAAAWERIPDGSLLWPEARLAVARLQVAAGQPAAAVASLRRLLDQPAPSDLSRPDPASRALLFAARTLATEPDPAEARRLLLDCWTRHPLAPEARECRAGLDALPPPHGAAPGTEDALRRAEALLDWNRTELALSEARRISEQLVPPGLGSPDSCRAAFVRGKALRKLRQYARAAEVLAPVADLCADPALRARALYLLAVARSNLATDDGIATYRRFAREFPDHPQADDALFFAADLLARQGAVDEAQRVLADLGARYPQGDFRAEALFRSAWLSRRQGRRDAAIETLRKVEEEFRDVDPYEHARAAYWRGRVLAERGAPRDRHAARSAWADVAKRYPTDYYGLLARARLAETGAPSAEVHPPAPVAGEGFRYRPGPLAADRHFRAALVLLRMGMSREAADELNAVDRRTLDPGGPGGPEPLLLLTELLDRAGDPKAAHGILRSQGRQILRQPPAGMGLRIWQVAYPPAWRDDVLRWAPPAGVPPDLLQAVMREESALDPAVVSAAGAIGLTQLMVPTAAQAARRLRLRAPTQSELADASLNIRLGAVHLGDLLRHFGGSAPLAVAAYNAGETPVRAWWVSHASLPLDEFVEEIPIQETRGYVKRVLRTYAAYRMLYGRAGEEPVRLGQRLPDPLPAAGPPPKAGATHREGRIPAPVAAAAGSVP